MALKIKNFSVNEDNDLLKPCWIAGARKFSSTHFLKLFARHEIEAVDVTSSCKRINDLIELNETRRSSQNDVAFKDIARLTLGVSYILSQQVSSLLNDTKHLLDKVTGTNFDGDFVALSRMQPQMHASVKRKRIITKQITTTTTTSTTVSVSKRAKILEPQLLDKKHVEYYRNMLDESQLWNTVSEVRQIEESQSIQMVRTLEHIISIRQELTFTKMFDEDTMWNDGFGTPKEADLTALEEFLPSRNSLKRKSFDISPTSVLCYKTPRLDKKLEMPMANNESDDTKLVYNKVTQAIDLCQDIDQMSMPPAPPSSPVVSQSPKCKRRRKSNLKIDKSTTLSREELVKRLKHKIQKLKSSPYVIPQKFKNTKVLQSSFTQEQLFPYHLKKRASKTSEQIELDSENTLRYILGDDYSDDLARDILRPSTEFAQLTNPIEVFELPARSSPKENSTSGATEEQLPANLKQPSINYNNNSVYKHKTTNEDNNFDSFSIMSDLLNIWRFNPDIKSIDAKQFIKSFPNRISVALAFNHLLTLSRDGFIQISTKEETVEIHEITLGAKSNELIENTFLAI